MIVWHGWGVLTVLIAAMALALGGAVLKGTMPEAYAMATALAIGAVANWFVGRWLNRGGARHKLFWVPMEWWSLALLAFAGAFVFGGISTATR